ncbi:MAG: hypothetical protein ACLQVL_31535 [Terriglobia bacterium]
MAHQRIVATVVLITILVLTLPAEAQQKPVAQGPRFGPAAFPSICAATALPVGGQQEPVAPGFSPAKPFTREQVVNMVRDGFGDESGAKLIGQRGIDFAPSGDFIQTLKAAGASEAFLKALRAAKPPAPASAKKPLNQVQVITLLAAYVNGNQTVSNLAVEIAKSSRQINLVRTREWD